MLTITPNVAADFWRASTQDVTAELGTPKGLRTIRVVLHFTHPLDNPLMVGAKIGFAHDGPVRITTTDPDGFYNDAGQFAGYAQDDFPNVPIGAPWDSWISLGGTTYLDSTMVLPEEFGGNGIPAIRGQLIEDDRRQWGNLFGWPDGADPSEIIIGQFTFAEGASFEMEGWVTWKDPAEVWQENYFLAASCGDPPADTVTTMQSCSRADLTGDQLVGVDDLLLVIENWGPRAIRWRPTSAEHLAWAWLMTCGGWCTREHDLIVDGFGTFDQVTEITQIGRRAASRLRTTLVASEDSTTLSMGGWSETEENITCWMDYNLEVTTTNNIFFEVFEPTAYSFSSNGDCNDDYDTIATLSGPLGFNLVCSGEGVMQPGIYHLYGHSRALEVGGWFIHREIASVLTLFDEGELIDIDGDGNVGFSDIIELLANWGPC